MSSQLTLHLNRNSVAAGDDVEPHDQTLLIQPPENLEAVLRAIPLETYLPRISGGKATWLATVSSGFGIPYPYGAFAVIAQQWRAPYMLGDFGITNYLDEDGALRIYFKYLAQQNPKRVLKALEVLRR